MMSNAFSFLSFDVAQGYSEPIHASQCNNKSKRLVESTVQPSDSNEEVIGSLSVSGRITLVFRRQQSSKASASSQLLESIKNGKYKRIVVLAGAGISTPSGIPDFRYLILGILTFSL